jgi:hypothetical protein
MATNTCNHTNKVYITKKKKTPIKKKKYTAKKKKK